MPEVTTDLFGQTKDGKDVTRYTLRNSSGSLIVRVLNYGAVVSEIHTPDRNGKVLDISPGFDDIQGHESSGLLFGAIVGRVTNRIAGAEFTLDGKTYNLHVSDGPNFIHGGKSGFQKKMWIGKVEGDRVKLTYVSPDGDEGFPGEFTISVSYRVTDNDELFIEYEGTTTKPTVVNLTSHIYFHLAGHNGGALDDHVVTIYSDSYLPLGEYSIPTGEISKVDGTPLDLRKPTRVGDRMMQVPGGKGFDNTFALPPCDGKPQLAAKMEHPPSGRYVECLTTMPGMHLYSGFYLDVPVAKGGATYKPFDSFCLEAQHFPDSVHHPNFPSTVVRPEKPYRYTTVYKFGVA